MAEFVKQQHGDWMQTISGRRFWPADPRPEDVDIGDIAHALSMMCRFNGHITRFYSVAEHSVLVSRHVPPEFALWGLLHDASEAYIADIVRPAKPFIAGYVETEARIMAAVCARFGLAADMPAEVKRVDDAILHDEALTLKGYDVSAWFLPQPPLGVEIVGRGPEAARGMFLHRYAELTGGEAR